MEKILQADTLGKRIALFRKELGLNKKQFAKLLGLSTGAMLYKWENDINEPNVKYIAKMIGLGLNTNWLLCGQSLSLILLYFI